MNHEIMDNRHQYSSILPEGGFKYIANFYLATKIMAMFVQSVPPI